MNIGRKLADASTGRAGWVIAATVAVTLTVALLAGLPNLMPETLSGLNTVTVDTDPENMLSEDEPVRVFHNRMKDRLNLHDIVVVGVVNEDGVFNPTSLRRVYELTEFAKTFQWVDEEDPRQVRGVVIKDLIAPSEVDVSVPSAGQLRFKWLMTTPPDDPQEAQQVLAEAQRVPFLKGTLVSSDGKAIALYLPLTEKKLSYRVYNELETRVPVLWLWGPMADRIESAELSNTARNDALVRLGRLAAFYSADRAAFEDVLGRTLNSLADGSLDLTAGKAHLEAWRDEAKAFDAELPASAAPTDTAPADEQAQVARARIAHDANQALVEFLADRAQEHPGDLPLRYALYRARAMNTTQMSAGEQLDAIGGFLADTQAQLDGSPDGYAALPDAFADVKSAHGQFPGPDAYHVTGLPVAEDTFGVEMFMQMAISAPSAMLVIFVLMMVFFRKFIVVLSPMLVALVSVVLTMGALVIAGFPVHIMSSMIPIFIMPIAVLDSIHIISEFFEKYQATRDRRQTLRDVMDELFSPMLYTSLTSAAGFASLALTPIPPVQVFGVFVAMGIMAAWLLTVTFIPAFVMFIPARRLENFGVKHTDEGEQHETLMGRILRWTGGATVRRAKPILAVAAVVLAVAGYGISQINVNDNPVKWFDNDHPIRVADRVLNDHFAGTYMAYLSVSAGPETYDPASYPGEFRQRADAQAATLADEQDLPQATGVFATLADWVAEEAPTHDSREALLTTIQQQARRASAQADDMDVQFAWDEAATFVALEKQRSETFKDPAALAHLADLSATMESTEQVGKSNSLADITRTLYRDLVSTEPSYGTPPEQDPNYKIPANRKAVGNVLFQYQNSHRPGRLYHFVTPDYRTASIWVQLSSGDNQDMQKVVGTIDAHLADKQSDLDEAGLGHLEHRWFGLTYINVVWQDKMVWGMLEAFAGSFLVVFLLMTLLFRSALWGLLSMVPLTVTIAAIYGAVGLVGKDYDMPTAVLSSLTLGLAVDFAIHFLARARAMHAEHGSWERTAPAVFGEPARAITRNIIVIAAGFLPLLLAPLVPYQTVGILLATILLVSGVATLGLLPALMKLLEKPLFSPSKRMGMACNCGTCISAAAALAGLIVINVYRYLAWDFSALAGVAVGFVLVAAIGCRVLSKRDACRVRPQAQPAKE